MPVIPSINLLSSTLDADEIANALYAPTTPASTYEVLNGGVDADNYAGGSSSIPAGVLQPGSLATGGRKAFEDWQIVYASQLSSQDAGANKRYRIALQASGDFFLPWQASLLILSWNMPVRQQGYVWDGGSSVSKVDRWDLRSEVDSTKLPSLYLKLPFGQQYPDTDAAARKGVGDDVDDMAENRWRYVSQMMTFLQGSIVARGVHQLRVTVWVDVYVADPYKYKFIAPSCSWSWCALR